MVFYDENVHLKGMQIASQGIPPGGTATAREALEPSPQAIEARFAEIARDRYLAGTRSWRSWRMAALLVPFFVINAFLPALPMGAELTRVPLEQSLFVFGVHAGLFAVACAVFAWRRDPYDRVYQVANRLESGWWIVGSAALVGLSGSAASVYWIHCAMVVVLVFPMVDAHRAMAIMLGMATVVAGTILVWKGAWADGIFGWITGGTLLLFHSLTMRISPRSVWAQARAELLAERASNVLLAAERQRIRRELHDGLGAELTALLWSAQSLDPDPQGDIRGLVERIREGMAELRVVMHAVAPEPMDADTLARELRRVVGRLGASGLAVDVAWRSEPPTGLLPGEHCHALLRATQESARNAARHGGATRLELRLGGFDALELTIEDDGNGDAADLKDGEGMRGIRERIAALGGSVTWEAAGKRGVRVRIRLPGVSTTSQRSFVDSKEVPA